jgi:hypothetical protein
MLNKMFETKKEVATGYIYDVLSDSVAPFAMVNLFYSYYLQHWNTLFWSLDLLEFFEQNEPLDRTHNTQESIRKPEAGSFLLVSGSCNTRKRGLEAASEM